MTLICSNWWLDRRQSGCFYWGVSADSPLQESSFSIAGLYRLLKRLFGPNYCGLTWRINGMCAGGLQAAAPAPCRVRRVAKKRSAPAAVQPPIPGTVSQQGCFGSPQMPASSIAVSRHRSCAPVSAHCTPAAGPRLGSPTISTPWRSGVQRPAVVCRSGSSTLGAGASVHTHSETVACQSGDDIAVPSKDGFKDLKHADATGPSASKGLSEAAIYSGDGHAEPASAAARGPAQKWHHRGSSSGSDAMFSSSSESSDEGGIAAPWPRLPLGSAQCAQAAARGSSSAIPNAVIGSGPCR